MSQKKRHCIYAQCWADIADFTQRITIRSFINSEHLQSSAYMNVMCLYIPKSFQSLKHWQQWLSFSLHPCHLFLSKPCLRLCEVPALFECQRGDGTVVREQHWFETTTIHTQKVGFLTNQVKVQSCMFSSICRFEQNHHLCYEGPFVLILSFPLCSDWEKRPLKCSLYIQ